jgi:penicillin amidase
MRLFRPLAYVVLALFLLAGLGVFFLASTRPPRDGRLRVAGLGHAVRIVYGRGGVPTVHARSLPDAYFALGYLEGAERFFQMDLLRRSAEGRLAALVGPAALPADRRALRWGFRRLAQRIWRRDPARSRRLLAAYAAGVNTALRHTPTRPLAYWFLGHTPRPWKPWQSYLVVAYMYRYLQDPSDRLARSLGALRASFPRPLYRFLAAPGNRWDAPDAGGPLRLPPIPGPAVFAFGKEGSLAPRPGGVRYLPAARAASNSFAVEGRLTRSGHALLANDPHLPLALPPIWYRVRLVYRTRSGRRINVLGVSLPGVPGIVIGTNGSIAWSMTDAMVASEMLLRVRLVPGRPGEYLTARGPRPFGRVVHRIPVRGHAPVVVHERTTVWGPVLGPAGARHVFVADWVGDDPAAYHDVRALAALLRARRLSQALARGSRLGVPAENFVVATRRGNIGWTIAGPVLRRVGRCGLLPRPYRAVGGRCRPGGFLPPALDPRIVDPPSGFLWTANQRVVGGRALALLGEGGAGYDLGARARQIRDDLRSLQPPLTVADLLTIERDDRALYLAHWRRLFLHVLRRPLASPARQAAVVRALHRWGGRAARGSVGFRLVHDFRRRVFRLVLAPFAAVVRRRDPRFRFPDPPMLEGPVWALVTHRPRWLLSPAFKSWGALLRAAARAVVRRAWQGGAHGFRRFTWGAWNVLHLGGPLGRAGGVLAWLYNLPQRPVSGDANMPRVVVRDFGASMRYGLAVGDDRSGYLELPGGESGDPLSVHYADELPGWLDGKRTPLLPPPDGRRLLLLPQKSSARAASP